MVIEGKVYALTEYLNDHPGGVEIMMQHAGKESTEAYNDIGHSKGARRILEKYQVGVLAPGEVVVKAPRAAAGAGGAGASLALYALGAAALAGALWYQFLRPAAAQ